MTVLVLALLVVLGYTVAFSARVNLHAALNAREALEAEYGAEAALNYAAALLERDGAETEVDTLRETWARPDLSVSVGGRDYGLTIVDEDRKLNVNRAVLEPKDPEKEFDLRDALKRLILSQGGTSRDFDALRAWIDPAAVGPDEDLAPNRPVPFITDLWAVPGLDPGLLGPDPTRPGLAALLSTHPEHININTAPEEVLAALWDDPAAAERALEYRSAEPFRSQADISSFLASAHGSEAMKMSASVLDVKSEFFSASIVPRGSLGERLVALLRRDGERVRILHVRRFWKEHGGE